MRVPMISSRKSCQAPEGERLRYRRQHLDLSVHQPPQRELLRTAQGQVVVVGVVDDVRREPDPRIVARAMTLRPYSRADHLIAGGDLRYPAGIGLIVRLPQVVRSPSPPNSQVPVAVSQPSDQRAQAAVETQQHPCAATHDDIVDVEPRAVASDAGMTPRQSAVLDVQHAESHR